VNAPEWIHPYRPGIRKTFPLSPRVILAASIIAALLPLLLTEVFSGQLYRVMDIAQYLVFHNVAEFFSVMVSLSIFGMGWKSYDQSRDGHTLFLSAAFLAIGLLDFMHTLGYSGMPPFVTANSANKSTQFWIAARLFSASAFLASAYVYPESRNSWLSKIPLMAAALAIPALVFSAITFFPSHVPDTFVEDAGLTLFKKLSEYLIMFLLLMASAAYWRRMRKTGNRVLVYYVVAFVVCIFSEAVFAIYKSVFDTFNVLGHLYKVGAFFLIYQGVFARSVLQPYVALSEVNDKLHIEISAHKHIEDELRESEEKFKYLFEHSPIGKSITTLSGAIHVNLAFCDMLGYSDEELGRTRWQDITHPDDIEATQSALAPLLAGKLDAARFSKRYLHKNGSVVWADVSTFVRRDSANHPLYFMTHVIDITERKRAEEQLQRAQTLLNDTQRVTKVGGWEYDVAAQRVTWTDEVYRIYGVARDYDPGNPNQDIQFYAPEDQAKMTEAFQRAIENGESYNLELQRLTAQGDRLWVKTVGEVERENGVTVRVFGNIMDITERKRAEEAIRNLNAELEQRVVERTAKLADANQELESFAYSVSHDLRTPLRAIDGFSQQVLNHYADKLDDEGKRYLNVVRDNTKKMGQLIDDILAFSRMGRVEMSRSEVGMEVLVREVFEELKLDTAGHEPALEIKPLPSAHGDRTMLRQVWMNLLGNAIKFTRHKPGATIQVGSYAEGKENVYFVRDNGAGFDMQYAGKLFGVFQRLHGVDEFEGTGIGLAIVKRIITRHGGRVWAEGKVDEGATFYFALPV
jgi:PAS domain S-box-containing protein